MKINFLGDISELKEGIDIVLPMLGLEASESGIPVVVSSCEKSGFSVKKCDTGYDICYSEKAAFFRALSFLREEREVSEELHFESIGAQLDVSQTNALPKLPEMREMLGRMALMGMNRFILYMEDSFEIAEEPYFGYMRSRYTEAELRAIDDIGYSLGIEVFAAIEGLAHLSKVLKWYPYGDFQEDSHTLLVGDERTYEFLGHLIDAATKPFRSKNVFVALDEAFNLGKGTSLAKSGEYHESFYYMKPHVNKLVEMCRERGLNMLTSGDMFMVASNPNEPTFFEKLYAVNGPLPKEIIDAASAPVDYILWDYSHLEEKNYEILIDRYREFGKTDFFLAGIWNWLGFGVDYEKSFATMIPALRASKRKGIKHFVVSSWGNSTGMENFWSDLLLGWQLAAEYSYGEEPSDEELAERFLTCTGGVMSDFMELSFVDHLYGQPVGVGPDYLNLSRSVLWQDILFGKYDYYIHDESMTEHFGKVAKNLREAVGRNGGYGKYLGMRAVCAEVMEIKADLGFKISKAYKSGDKATLSDITERVLPLLREKVTELRDTHRNLWYAVYKPLGWEVEDIRYGALLSRIESAAYRLGQYLSGEISSLPELLEKRLSVNGGEKMPRTTEYLDVVTPSYVTPGE